jgi:hypothetical protein
VGDHQRIPAVVCFLEFFLESFFFLSFFFALLLCFYPFFPRVSKGGHPACLYLHILLTVSFSFSLFYFYYLDPSLTQSGAESGAEIGTDSTESTDKGRRYSEKCDFCEHPSVYEDPVYHPISSVAPPTNMPTAVQCTVLNGGIQIFTGLDSLM